ncbi:hypothetical protein JTB14_023981 [Gonioctena quinquepunctata]|nr:hypothetical protein JTB14_023981 [Gonioctena quinquepunctata]
MSNPLGQNSVLPSVCFVLNYSLLAFVCKNINNGYNGHMVIICSDSQSAIEGYLSRKGARCPAIGPDPIFGVTCSWDLSTMSIILGNKFDDEWGEYI